MSTIPATFAGVQCDRCHQIHPTPCTSRGYLEWEKQTGWYHNADRIKDFCPPCAEAERADGHDARRGPDHG